MKVLINEYQTVIISAIASVFIFLCVYTIVPDFVNSIGFKTTDELSVLTEKNDTYSLKLYYPFGNRINMIKGQKFDVGKYILVSDNDEVYVTNYKYKLYVNGKETDTFLTDSCGGYHLLVEVSYRNKLLQGELLLIIEER